MIERDRPVQVLVEGSDDKLVIEGLVKIWNTPSDQPHIVYARGESSIPQKLTELLKTERLTNLCVILDADTEGPESRWKHLRDSVTAFSELPAAWNRSALQCYLNRDSGLPRIRLGVWIMPDNTKQGTLEDFLLSLVPQTDLWSYARDACLEAKLRGAQYPDQAFLKSRLHTWLAWQKKPALRPGRAIKEGILKHENADRNILAFRDWLGYMSQPDSGL